jgi:hypothetical protein
VGLCVLLDVFGTLYQKFHSRICKNKERFSLSFIKDSLDGALRPYVFLINHLVKCVYSQSNVISIYLAPHGTAEVLQWFTLLLLVGIYSILKRLKSSGNCVHFLF